MEGFEHEAGVVLPLSSYMALHSFFYKNRVYKNVEVEIGQKSYENVSG